MMHWSAPFLAGCMVVIAIDHLASGRILAAALAALSGAAAFGYGAWCAGPRKG